ncbi:MAG TPA: DMT family transporter [Myxococcales bacterium]|nr:DMT family transporter [Myxococcales bacterium]
MRPRPAAALSVLAVSSLVFSLMAVSAKAAAARLPGSQVAFVRFVIGIAACALISVRRPMRPRNRTGLLLRGLFGGGAVLCYFLAIEHLPVGVATLLNYTAPVFTAIWAAMFLHEPLDATSVGALALATAGVVLVSLGTSQTEAAPVAHWVLVGALSAVLSGAAVAAIREVRKTDGAWETFAAFCLAGALITGVPGLRGWTQPSAREWWLLAAVGIFAVAGQMGFTWSMRYVRAAPAGVVQQLTPVGALALGWMAYGDRISRLSALGALLALTGVSWGAWHISRGVLPEDA